MSSSEQKMQPWQVFHAANKYLGPERVARIWNKEKRSAYNWGQDPAFTGSRCHNPLELLHAQFAKMDDAGIGYIARAGIRYLETAIDPDAVLNDPESFETLPTITDEVLADFAAVAALNEAINNGEDMAAIKLAAAKAIAEIERTVAKVAQECGK